MEPCLEATSSVITLPRKMIKTCSYFPNAKAFHYLINKSRKSNTQSDIDRWPDTESYSSLSNNLILIEDRPSYWNNSFTEIIQFSPLNIYPIWISNKTGIVDLEIAFLGLNVQCLITRYSPFFPKVHLRSSGMCRQVNRSRTDLFISKISAGLKYLKPTGQFFTF